MRYQTFIFIFTFLLLNYNNIDIFVVLPVYDGGAESGGGVP